MLRSDLGFAKAKMSLEVESALEQAETRQLLLEAGVDLESRGSRLARRMMGRTALWLVALGGRLIRHTLPPAPAQRTKNDSCGTHALPA